MKNNETRREITTRTTQNWH